MSKFEDAIETILLHEGLFSNDPKDTGGATNYGVSLRQLRAMVQIDSSIYANFDRDDDHQLTIDDIKNMDKESAINFYKQYWWERYRYAEILDQLIATKSFDLSVNIGPKPAHVCLQRAVRAASGVALLEDGLLGALTFAAVNQSNPEILLAALRSEAAGYYRSLKNPNFEKGWLNRAYS